MTEYLGKPKSEPTTGFVTKKCSELVEHDFVWINNNYCRILKIKDTERNGRLIASLLTIQSPNLGSFYDKDLRVQSLPDREFKVRA